mmetsp:Transcript_33577/g.72780  ORF Transcript_33577/g.72780 Transcript_33577/m.72780 type:complete len:213 (-) Transcript_33577:1943-2581(-)
MLGQKCQDSSPPVTGATGVVAAGDAADVDAVAGIAVGAIVGVCMYGAALALAVVVRHGFAGATAVAAAVDAEAGCEEAGLRWLHALTAWNLTCLASRWLLLSPRQVSGCLSSLCAAAVAAAAVAAGNLCQCWCRLETLLLQGRHGQAAKAAAKAAALSRSQARRTTRTKQLWWRRSLRRCRPPPLTSVRLALHHGDRSAEEAGVNRVCHWCL